MTRRKFITTFAATPWLLGGCAHPRRAALGWKQCATLPDQLGVAAPFAGVSEGSVVVAGGTNFPNGLPWQGGRKVWHDRVYRLEAPDAAWENAGTLPRPLAYGVSINTNRGIVCIGGSDAGRHHASVLALNLKGRSLRVDPMPSLPVPLSHSAGAFVGGRILLCGGSSEPGEQSALNRLWSLDFAWEAAGWRELESLPAAARFLPVAAARGDDFYVFGGVGLKVRDGRMSRVYLRDAWHYRFGAGWRRLANLPHALAAAPSPAPVIGKEIVLLPGDDGSLLGFQPAEKHPGFPRRMLAYDTQRNAWRDAGEAPFAQVTTACVEWRGRFVVPGGEVRPGVRSPEVWSLIQP